MSRAGVNDYVDMYYVSSDGDYYQYYSASQLSYTGNYGTFSSYYSSSDSSTTHYAYFTATKDVTIYASGHGIISLSASQKSTNLWNNWGVIILVVPT